MDSEQDPLALSAQLLFCLWVVRVSLRWLPSTPLVLGEASGAIPEQIFAQVCWRAHAYTHIVTYGIIVVVVCVGVLLHLCLCCV